MRSPEKRALAPTLRAARPPFRRSRHQPSSAVGNGDWLRVFEVPVPLSNGAVATRLSPQRTPPAQQRSWKRGLAPSLRGACPPFQRARHQAVNAARATRQSPQRTPPAQQRSWKRGLAPSLRGACPPFQRSVRHQAVTAAHHQPSSGVGNGDWLRVFEVPVPLSNEACATRQSPQARHQPSSGVGNGDWLRVFEVPVPLSNGAVATRQSPHGTPPTQRPARIRWRTPIGGMVTILPTFYDRPPHPSPILQRCPALFHNPTSPSPGPRASRPLLTLPDQTNPTPPRQSNPPPRFPPLFAVFFPPHPRFFPSANLAQTPRKPCAGSLCRSPRSPAPTLEAEPPSVILNALF